MASQSSAVTLRHQIETVDDLRPSPAVRPVFVLRYHQKVAAVCFAAVGLIATAGWFYLIAMVFRAVVRWL
jgi:hypothetical protein